MGGTEKSDCRNLFGRIPMPATYQQLKDGVETRKGSWYLASRYLRGGVAAGWIVKEGDHYWLSDEVLAEGIAMAEGKITSWQEPLDYWQAQRMELAGKGLIKARL